MTKKICFLLFGLMAGISSCDQGDGNDRTPVTYKLLAGSNTVTSISFTGANGEPATVATNQLSDVWQQKIWVVKPFDASATVVLQNNLATDQQYVLQIFKRDELVTTVVDTVAAMTEFTATATGTISN